MQVVEQARSWTDAVKGDLNQALISLGLVLLMFVVFSNWVFLRVVAWL